MELNQEEDNKKIFKNSIEYLHRISSILKTPALKSIFYTKSRLMELRQGIFLPSLNKASVKCQRCLLNFHDGPAKYSIKKSQKLNKFAKKYKAKEQSGKPLTAYQRKFLKKFKYHEGNTLVIKCKFCEKAASIELQKPQKVKPILLDTPKKKKKRKDKSCGLNKEVLRSIAPSKDASVIVLDETVVETNQNDKSVIVVEDSFARTPKKAKKVVTSVRTKSLLAKGSPITPKNKHKNVMDTSILLKDSPRMPKNKDILKGNENKHNLKGNINEHNLKGNKNKHNLKGNKNKHNLEGNKNKHNLKGNKNKVKGKAIDKKVAKKKKKNLSKLGSLLNDSHKKSPSSNLKHFLQSL